MQPQNEKRIRVRPPVIVVMGHIDHGKSTLLDRIRKENTVETETGGITQHIGAYETVYTDANGGKHPLTFIDTPGHEAFGTERAHGAHAADIAILVVSAEDGVKPQTLEALSRIKEGKLPYCIAVNKTDRPGADVERVKANLAEHEVYVEGYGGDVPWVALSALTGAGIPELLDTIVLMAQLANLTADPEKRAEGVIIEAHLDRKRGNTATLIIKNGTLARGTYLVAGDSYSPVRAIERYDGTSAAEAQASSPVRIVGWSKLPLVGASIDAVPSRKEAERLAAEHATPTVRELPPENESEGTVTIPLIVKADTSGSLEAVLHELRKINVEGIRLKILGKGVGAIGENDVKLLSGAAASVIIGFNVGADAQAKTLAERLSIPVKEFDIIYRLTEWISEECEKRRPRKETEEETARAKVLKLFSADKGRYIVGGRVESGTLNASATVKIIRHNNEIGRGKVRNLQQQRVKAIEVGAGREFGAMIEASMEPAPGDMLQAYAVRAE